VKLRVSDRHSVPSETADENLEIDVTPIMNMFVVLIPFLVSMAVFSHLAVHQFNLPSEAGANLNQNDGPVKFKTTVVITENALLVTVGGEQIDSLPTSDGYYPFESLPTALTLARAVSGDRETSVVSVRDKVAFKYVVAVMDICRESGFSSVGLASAPEEIE